MRKAVRIVASCRIVGMAIGLASAALLLTAPLAAQDVQAGEVGPDGPNRGLPPLTWELRTFDYDPAALGRQGPASRFYNDHLMPRMQRSFETYNGVWLTRDAPGTVNQDVIYEVWSEAAERQAHRATRKALTDYLLEETSLSRVVARISRRRHASAVDELQQGGRRAGTVRWDFGISHGLPKVDMHCAVGARRQASVKFSLGGDGRFRVEFRPGQLTRTRVRATWLLEDNEYHLGANFAF